MGWRGFKIDAQQLLLPSHDPELHGGINLAVDLQASLDPGIAEELPQGPAGFVVTDDRQQGDDSPKAAALRATLAAPPRRSSSLST